MQNPSAFSSSVSRREAFRALAMTAGAFAFPSLLLPRLASAEEAKAAPTPVAPPALKTISLADRLTVITGAGGNVAVFTGEDGTVVVDAGVPAAAIGLIGEVSKLSKTPAATLINTHWHFDHTGGNDAFSRGGARIIAHANCRVRVSTDQVVEFLDMKAPASPKGAWPASTFTGEMSVHANGEEIHLTGVAPAHTDGDILVLFPKVNVLHMGDLYFNGSYPFIDYSSRGWIGGLVVGAEKALSLTDASTKIIPGHGPIATQDDLKGYLAFLKTAHERLAKFQKEGKTVDEVIAALPMKDYDDKLGKGFMPPDKFLRCTYTGLLRHG